MPKWYPRIERPIYIYMNWSFSSRWSMVYGMVILRKMLDFVYVLFLNFVVLEKGLRLWNTKMLHNTYF